MPPRFVSRFFIMLLQILISQEPLLDYTHFTFVFCFKTLQLPPLLVASGLISSLILLCTCCWFPLTTLSVPCISYLPPCCTVDRRKQSLLKYLLQVLTHLSSGITIAKERENILINCKNYLYVKLCACMKEYEKFKHQPLKKFYHKPRTTFLQRFFSQSHFSTARIGNILVSRTSSK